MTIASPPLVERAAHEGARVAVAEMPYATTQSGRIRRWGLKSALSIVDQGLTAAVGFGVNFLLARWLPTPIYGAFAVAFAVFLFISGFYNAILLEPLTVLGPSMHAKTLYAYFRKQVVVHTLLVGVLSAVILLVAEALLGITPQSPLPAALFGSAVALPFLLLIWLVRRMCYVLQRPSIAVFGSFFYVTFTFVGLRLLHQFHLVTPFIALVLTGAASLLASGLLWMRLGLPRSDDPLVKRELSWRQVLREDWKYGRWLVASTALNSVSNQVQMFLVAGALGLSAAGALRAMQIPALVMIQIIAATGLLVLPAFSYDFGFGSIDRMRRKATLVSVALAGITLTFALLLTPFAGRAEQVLFGGKYAEHAWLMPVLALVPTALGASTGYSMALRASQRPHFDLLASAIAAPVGLISAIILIHWWGLAGAAASVVLSSFTSSIATCWAYRASAPHAKHGITNGKSGTEIPLLDVPSMNAASNWIVPTKGASARQLRVPCPVCGSSVAHCFSLPHTSVWECLASKCKLQFADPQLDDHNLIQAYKSLYYPSESNGRAIHFENTSESVLRQVLYQLQKRMGNLTGLRLLDYGCGVGLLLRLAAEFGAWPTGIESDAQARSTATTVTGAPVYRSIEQLSGADRSRSFDVIVLWTVVEHLRRPWEDLAGLRRLLSPEGWLLISTINIRCLRARIQRHRWVQYSNPTHFYYFDRSSLPRVIEKAGFSDVSEWRLRIRYPHHGALRRSLHYANSVAGLADGLFYLCRNGQTEQLKESSSLTAPEQGSQMFDKIGMGSDGSRH